MAEKIDPKYLKGLKYRFSEPKEIKEEGRTIIRYFPQERALKQEDVINWKDYGDRLVLVTADGKKVTVATEPKKQDNSDKPEGK